MLNSKILFLGDVYLDKNYEIPQTDCPIIFNLEAPLTQRNTPIAGKITLKSSGKFLKDTFNPLPAAVCLANNHIMDYGNDGFLDTINFLENNNIRYFGCGIPQENYNNPLVMSCNGFKIGLLGYCYKHFYDQIVHVKGLEYGPAPLDYELVERDIKGLCGKVDRIIVSVHWGEEHSNYPNKENIIFARRLISLGADLIVGHHAHTIQPVEQYDSCHIAYCLGNFIFPNIKSIRYFNISVSKYEEFKYKQRSWNRCSAGLIYSPASNKLELKKYYFNGQSVCEGKKYFHNYLSNKHIKDIDRLTTKIEQNVRKKRIVCRISNFIENPRIPSFEGIKNFIFFR